MERRRRGRQARRRAAAREGEVVVAVGSKVRHFEGELLDVGNVQLRVGGG